MIMSSNQELLDLKAMDALRLGQNILPSFSLGGDNYMFSDTSTGQFVMAGNLWEIFRDDYGFLKDSGVIEEVFG